MAVVSVIAAVLVGVAAIVRLAWTDPKRRRVFGLDAYEGPRRVWLLLLVLVAPGALLLAAGDAAGFTIWIGALTVLGWAVAALSPDRSAAVAAGIRRRAGGAGGAVVAVRSALARGVRTVREAWHTLRHAPTRLAALERRVAELEAEAAGRTRRGEPEEGSRNALTSSPVRLGLTSTPERETRAKS